MESFTNKYKNIILPLILKRLKKVKVILYGSRARGDDREGSDIDIALDIGKKIDDSIMTAIVGDIEESDLPISFDIVDINSLSKKMQNEILKDGKLWH